MTEDSDEDETCLMDIIEDPGFESSLIAAVFGEERETLDTPTVPEYMPTAITSRHQSCSGESRSPFSTGASPDAIWRIGQCGGTQLRRMRGSKSEGALTPVSIRGRRPVKDAQHSLPPLRMGGTTCCRAAADGGGKAGGSGEAGGGLLSPESPAWRQKRIERADARSQQSPLSRMLDDVLIPTWHEIQVGKQDPSRSETIAQLQTLREAMRRADVLDRVVDLFHKCDIDNSGDINREEFTSCIKSLLPETRTNEITALFDEFDEDGQGTITYVGRRTTRECSCDRPVSARFNCRAHCSLLP